MSLYDGLDMGEADGGKKDTKTDVCKSIGLSQLKCTVPDTQWGLTLWPLQSDTTALEPLLSTARAAFSMFTSSHLSLRPPHD